MKNKGKNRLITAVKAVLLAVLLAGLLVILKDRGGIQNPEASGLQPEMQEPAADTQTEERPAEEPVEAGPDTEAGKVIVTEVMVKNKAALLCEDFGFFDWIELKNVSDGTVSLSGWTLSDKAGGLDWSFPEGTEIESGEYLIVYAAGTGIDADGLFAGFSLSEKDTVTLCTPRGTESSSVPCADTDADISYAMTSEGSFAECSYPTPGAENSLASYVLLQTEKTSESAVIINEAASSNFSLMYNEEKEDYPDWIELKNNSASSVSLSGWTITDDITVPDKVVLPDVSIAPGGVIVIQCFDGEETRFDGEYIVTDLGLDGENEQLYLFCGGELADYISITDVSYGGSVGRMPEENGLFKFTQPSPGEDNSGGLRYMCARPATAEPDGVFEDVESVTVTLTGTGDIYYTLDGSLPTTESTLYTGPVCLEQTSVIRAICSDGTGIDSRPLTASYIINEGHSLPVISVVGDDATELERIYRQGQKGIELPGAIEFFDGENSFSIDCGVRMAGRASLGRAQKNLTFKFRGRYGESRLEYPLYEEGFSSFSSLTLRSGHDSTKAVIRNEISEDLCLAATDKVAAQRSRWCVMYLNGQYYGVFALKDKINEDFLASTYGVSEESIELDETPTYESHEFYKTVIDFTIRSDMTADGNYEQLCSILDIESFIDWIIMEQYTGNFDILYGNTGFFRSTELDGNRWKAVFYDLDAAFRYDYYSFRNFFNIDYKLNVYAQMLTSLFKVDEFRDQYLSRVAELLSDQLSNENVTEMICAMYDVIDAEIPRECERWNQPYETYIECRDELKGMITGSDYESYAVEIISGYLQLTDEEVEHYFGAINNPA